MTETRVAPGRQSERPPAQAHTRKRKLSRGTRLRHALAPRAHGYQLALLVIVLAVWEVVGLHAASYTFAPPSSIVPATHAMLANGELQRALGQSAVSLVLGFVTAGIVGIGLGFAMGWWHIVGRTLDPFVAALYVVPIVALVPSIIVWFGLGLEARVIVVFLFALFEILLNAYAGMKNVDRAIVDVARVFGARKRDFVLKAVLPATLPFVFVGLRIGASRAIKGMVLAEMLFASTGLGGLIIRYGTLFRMDRVFTVVIVISLLGILLTACVQVLERFVMRWQR